MVSRNVSRLKPVPPAAGGSVVLLGSLALLGRSFHLTALNGVLPGLVTMKPNAALAFILAGVSLGLSWEEPARPWARRIARGCAVAALLIGALTLCQYLFGWDLHIDQLLIHDDPSAAGTSPAGRMAPQAALNFLLIGIAMLLVDGKAPRARLTAQSSALLAIFLSIQALIGYAYGVKVFFAFAAHPQIALHTALAFILLGGGVLCARPDRGLMSVLAAEDPAGWMARRLLAATLVTLPVAGWFRLAGERAGYYDAAFGVSLIVLSSMVMLTGVIIWTANSLLRVDDERRRAENALQARESWFVTTLGSIGDAVIATDKDGRISFINPVAATLTGWTREEAIGRPLGEVFVIIHEETRLPIEHPVARVLREGQIVGPASHTLLIARDGSETPIDDSAAPIREGEGIQGMVLTFRDVTEAREVERTFRESEERFRHLFESSQAVMNTVAEGLYTVDARGLVTYVNPAAEALFGWTSAELIGRKMHDVTHYPHPDGTPFPTEECAGLQVSQGGMVLQEHEDVFIRKDGSFFPVVYSAAPLTTDGKIVGVVVSFRDDSQRKQAEAALRESEERLAGIIGSAMDAILSLDEEQRIVVFNAAAERMFRCCATEVLGQPIDRFIPQRFRGTHHEHIRSFGRTGGTSRSMTSPGTLTALRADGEEFPIEATISQVLVGHQKLFTVILRDITERKQVEEALRRAHDELEIRVQERTADLEEADRAKDQFLAMLAHELRNPMGAISNAVQLLRLVGPAEPRLTRARETIARQVEHTGRMLDDLLNVTRIARGKVSLHLIRLDLTLLVRDTMEDFRSQIEAAGLLPSLELPEQPVWTAGDPTRLAQVIGNLIHNAAKFTPQGGQVSVRLFVEPESQRAVIAVRDTGIGIEPEMLARVFDIFAQADRSIDRSRGGLGLGLALVKGLVELHGGQVQAASAGLGQGAEFTIRLPLTAPALAAPAPEVASTPTSASPLRILVIEDNCDLADSLRELLEAWGCRVEVAYTGRAGIEVARNSRPELVLCDLGLPGLDGYGVAAALRTFPELAPARLVAMSGYGQEEDLRRSREAGFDLHLVKPVAFSELQQLLEVTPAYR